MEIKENIFISVIMPYYNSEKFISKAINSILNQTYRNFEFILLDDGSTDRSQNIVNSFVDSRMIKFVNKKNIGHPKSMNKLIDLAKGEYIAIMDSDDISKIDRLKVQLDYMIENNLDVCGSSAMMFDNIQNKKIQILEKHDDISFMMMFGNPIINPSTMSKSNVFKKFKWNESYISADFDVYSRIAQNNYKIGNVKKQLIYSRVHRNQDSLLNYSIGINDSYLISLNHYKFYNIKKN
jgi:glycosyltransferase involved in cell wall biosynthesis